MNIILDANSIFKPFDINPALHIMDSYNTNFDKQLEKLEKILEDLSDLDYTGLKKEYRDVVDNYNNNIYSAANSMYESGLNPDTWRLLSKAYMSKKGVGKIRKGIEAYNKYADKVNTLAADPNTIITKRYDVNDFIDGSTTGEIHAINGELVAKESMALTKSILDLLDQKIDFEKTSNPGLLYLILSGLISIDLVQEIAKDPYSYNLPPSAAVDALNVLNLLDEGYKSMYNRYGYNGLSTENKDKFKYFANLGILLGMPARTKQVIHNPTYTNRVGRSGSYSTSTGATTKQLISLLPSIKPGSDGRFSIENIESLPSELRAKLRFSRYDDTSNYNNEGYYIEDNTDFLDAFNTYRLLQLMKILSLQPASEISEDANLLDQEVIVEDDGANLG